MNKKGFTLIELLIVIAIIGIIAAIAIPNMLMALQKSRQKGSMMGLHNIATALEGAKADRGELFVFQNIGTLNTDFLDHGSVPWLVPVHLSVQPNLDRWGTQYDYVAQDPTDDTSWYVYQIGCYGKDGMAGTGAATGAGGAALSGFPLADEPSTPMEFFVETLENFGCDIIFIDGMGIQVPSTGTSST